MPQPPSGYLITTGITPEAAFAPTGKLDSQYNLSIRPTNQGYLYGVIQTVNSSVGAYARGLAALPTLC